MLFSRISIVLIRRWHWRGQPPPLATGAVYAFAGFPRQPDHHFFFHHDGYPTGAAWRFASALRDAPEPAAFHAAFLRSQPGAEPIEKPEQAADAEYR